MDTQTRGEGGSAGKPHRARQGLVLVVEGDADVRDTIQLTLRRDYEVVSLADGQGFLEAVEAYNPDLIILSSGLPEPQHDGYRMYAQLRAQARFRNIPVLFFAGRRGAGEAAFMKTLENHGDAYLTKPFGREELLETATKLITAAL